jgi:transposase
VKKKREEFKGQMAEEEVEGLVFLDETWAKTNMARQYGRAPKGQRVVDHVPHGHWKTCTFLAALRTEGIVAPLVLDGPIDGDSFRAWVEQHLAVTLKPGDTVVMDNLSSHKVKGVREAIEAVGARVCYLPPYSPDLNPIEMFFSKLKALLRKFKERTFDALQTRLGSLLNEFSQTECLNYISHCGYRAKTC